MKLSIVWGFMIVFNCQLYENLELQKVVQCTIHVNLQHTVFAYSFGDLFYCNSCTVNFNKLEALVRCFIHLFLNTIQKLAFECKKCVV